MLQEHAVVLSIDDNGSEAGPLSEQQQQQYKSGPGGSDLRASIDGTHPQQPLLLASSPAHTSAARHRAAGAQRDGSDSSLVFEMDAPEEGPLLAGASGGGAGTGASRSVISVSFLTAVLMGVALCFHSLLEGAAMGAQPTIRCGAAGVRGEAGWLAAGRAAACRQLERALLPLLPCMAVAAGG
jgi:zinc transporter 1/2/3